MGLALDVGDRGVLQLSTVNLNTGSTSCAAAKIDGAIADQVAGGVEIACGLAWIP